MILIVGASAAGKSTIEKELVKNGYTNIISYTSRPMRPNEINHKDYHFITKEEFLDFDTNGFFAEKTLYNSWDYGISKNDLLPNSIAVVEPYGMRTLKKICKEKNILLMLFFIDVPEKIRLKRMIDRNDNLMEMFRRILSDQGVFQGIKDEVDYVINNDRPIKETIQEIIGCLQNF